MPEDDLVCPECGGPIGTTSAYCMHCSADLTEDHPARNAAEETAARSTAGRTTAPSADAETSASDDVWMETEYSVVDTVDLDALRNGESTAHPQDLPAEYRSTSGAVDRTKLLPEGFAVKAVTLVLAIVAGSVVGIASMYVLSWYIEGWIAFPLGVCSWLGATALFVRLVPG